MPQTHAMSAPSHQTGPLSINRNSRMDPFSQRLLERWMTQAGIAAILDGKIAFEACSEACHETSAPLITSEPIFRTWRADGVLIKTITRTFNPLPAAESDRILELFRYRLPRLEKEARSLIAKVPNLKLRSRLLDKLPKDNCREMPNHVELSSILAALPSKVMTQGQRDRLFNCFVIIHAFRLYTNLPLQMFDLDKPKALTSN
jgi:hypothetical protein